MIVRGETSVATEVKKDDPSIQLLYEEELSEEAYEVISSDGEKGLLQLIAAKRPDLILLDVKLRSRSGLDLLQDIRNAFQRIPVILTTAYPAFELDPKSVASQVPAYREDLLFLCSGVQKRVG